MMGRLAALAMLAALSACSPRPLTVGSKGFTESVVLGELARLALQEGEREVVHKAQLGGSPILFKALERGDIDLYPDYTGTIALEQLGGAVPPKVPALRAALAARGIGISEPLGFNNTYAIGVKAELAERLGLKTVSDLARHPELRLGFSSEFMERRDGWPGLKAAYGLPQSARGLDHDLAYRGLESDAIDVIDLYSTDAEIAYYGLVTLEDDRAYFPEYRAVLVYRLDRAAALRPALERLEGRIPAAQMVALNREAKIDKRPEAQVAAGFLERELGLVVEVEDAGVWERRARALRRNTIAHIELVSIALLLAALVAIPAGIAAAQWPRAGRLILGAVGVVQTMPALALLVFMIPLFGIGEGPAIVALFLYSLLPIVRNTHAGLVGIPADLRESALALGLPWRARLWRVELPLALPSILAGVQTSAVITIGTATLGALIGTGGYGQPILQGIRLDSTPLILQGAIPAALLALAAQGAFELLERWLVSPALRVGAEG